MLACSANGRSLSPSLPPSSKHGSLSSQSKRTPAKSLGASEEKAISITAPSPMQIASSNAHALRHEGSILLQTLIMSSNNLHVLFNNEA